MGPAHVPHADLSPFLPRSTPFPHAHPPTSLDKSEALLGCPLPDLHDPSGSNKGGKGPYPPAREDPSSLTMDKLAVDAITGSLAASLLVSYTVQLHVTRPGEDPAWLILLRYLLLIVLLVPAALFLCLSWKAPWLALNANKWRALSHGLIGLSFISTQVPSHRALGDPC